VTAGETAPFLLFEPMKKSPEINLYDAYLSNHYAIEELDILIEDMVENLKFVRDKRKRALAGKKRIETKYTKLTGWPPLKVK
jgi:hypothetical protein